MTVALDHKHTIEGKGTREQSITTGQRSMIPTEQATSTEGGRLSKAEQVRETALRLTDLKTNNSGITSSEVTSAWT